MTDKSDSDFSKKAWITAQALSDNLQKSMKKRRIALLNLEPKIVNTALMQISQFHKEQGDRVEWYQALKHIHYDKIYCSSIFTYTEKPAWIYGDKRVVYGGSGFDLETKLPEKIANCNYDWSLYPDCDYSIIWFSRGCINNCPFCIVRRKEGSIRAVEPKNLNPNGRYIKIMDNNFFANPKWREAIAQIKSWGQAIEFNQGIDVRLLTEEILENLQTLDICKNKKIYTAWDLPKQDLRPQFKRLLEYIPYYRIGVYVLVGFNSTFQEDMFRVEELRKLRLDPFVMIYNHLDEPLLKHFARWVNHKPEFKTGSFEDYLKRKKFQDIPFEIFDILDKERVSAK